MIIELKLESGNDEGKISLRVKRSPISLVKVQEMRTAHNSQLNVGFPYHKGSEDLEIKVMIYGLIGLDLHHVVAVAIPRRP